MEPDEIFKQETDESLDKLRCVRHVMAHFRSSYERTRKQIYERVMTSRAVKKRKQAKDVANLIWDFPSQMAFGRHDQFANRISQLEVICS